MKIKIVYDIESDLIRIGLRGKTSIIELGAISIDMFKDVEQEKEIIELTQTIERLFNGVKAIWDPENKAYLD